MATLALQGWHPGELVVQKKLGFDQAVSGGWKMTENFMREQHRIFHTSNLPFIPITTADSQGRPWVSILSGATGGIGFVKSPNQNTLVVNTHLWEGDPLLDTLRIWLDPKQRQASVPERFLIAGVGVEYTTRRRNKFAGLIRSVEKLSEIDYNITLHVNETLGNCPKYINIRQIVPRPNTTPVVLHQNLQLQPTDRLPEQAIKMIQNADTIFLGSLFKPDPSIASSFPSHAGMNSRGGLPGFVRVKPSDGKTVVVPDYSGNRFLMTLGNIEASHLASMTIADFITGDILCITGNAQVLIGEPATKIMTRHASVLTIETTGYVLIQNALPFQQQPGTSPETSPYSPKIKYLVDEPEALLAGAGGSGHKAQLTTARLLSNDLAVFGFQVKSSEQAAALAIKPGQAVVLDFMDWIGPPTYKHMANDKPESINDDRVRTWTVSSAHEGEATKRGVTYFEMTMREMQGGAVTGALFDVIRKHQKSQAYGHSLQLESEEIVSDIVGVTGDFTLSKGPVHSLFIAGGIGITPFLSMLSAIAARGNDAQGDVVLALAARDAEPFIKMIDSCIDGISPNVHLHIDVFTKDLDVDAECLSSKGNVKFSIQSGRIPPEYWTGVSQGRDAFICGPAGFGDAAVEGLRNAGVPNSNIHREGFY